MVQYTFIIIIGISTLVYIVCSLVIYQPTLHYVEVDFLRSDSEVGGTQAIYIVHILYLKPVYSSDKSLFNLLDIS